MTARYFRLRSRAVAAPGVILIVALSPAIAQDSGLPKRPVSNLFQQFAGNTVSGYNSNGNKFTEYHSPDGRIFGYNWGRITLNACWRTNGPDIVCYYYDKGGETRNESCWRFEPVGESGYKIVGTNHDTTGMVYLEAGNPHDWNDQGQSWTCDALMVQAPEQQIPAPEEARNAGSGFAAIANWAKLPAKFTSRSAR